MKVMITGTASGIGRATAEFFLARGHEVHGVDVKGASIGHERYFHYIADVADIKTLERALPAGFAPEILINNAGIQEGGRDIEVNLKGMIAVTERYAIGNKSLKAVVNVGSAAGHTGAEFPEYAASKGGVMSYTKNVALRVAPHAVCNSVDPGGVLTDINKPVMEDRNLWEKIMKMTPLRRWAEPEEIAEWIYFLSVNNRFMTGQNLLIDGGESGNVEFVWPD